MKNAIVALVVLAVVGCGGGESCPPLDASADEKCSSTYLARCEADAASMREPGAVYEVRTAAMICDDSRILCGCCMTEPDPPFPGGEFCWVNDPQQAH